MSNTALLTRQQSAVRSAAMPFAIGAAASLVVLTLLTNAALAVAGATAALVMVCGAIDELTGRIPNRLVLVGLITTAFAVPVVALQSGRSTAAVLASAFAGLVLTGAPVLFVIWLVRPLLIGGGDWKLLGVVGLAIGLVDPLLAAVTTFIACLVQFVRFAATGRRVIPFGPSIATGFIGALCLGLWLEHSGGLTP